MSDDDDYVLQRGSVLGHRVGGGMTLAQIQRWPKETDPRDAHITRLEAQIAAADALAVAMESYFLSSIVTAEMYHDIRETLAAYTAAKAGA